MVEKVNDDSLNEVLLFEAKPNIFAEKVEFIISTSRICILICAFFIFFPLMAGGKITISSFVLSLLISCVVSFLLFKFFNKRFQQSCKRNKVKVTNKKIEFYDENFQKYINIPLNEIRNFYVKQDFLDKKLNCADIKINTEVDSFWIKNINEFKNFYFIVKENTKSFVEPIIVDGREIKCKIKENERIVWEGKQNRIFSFLLSLMFVIAFASLFVVMAISLNDVKMILFFSMFFFVAFLIIIASEYPYWKNFKNTYYVITDKRILYCNKDTDGVCRVIPFEIIKDCYIFKRRKKERRLKIITDRTNYEFFDFGDLNRTLKILKEYIVLRKK